MGKNTAGQPAAEGLIPSERFKAFADAVVAIAITLLILPLMDSVSDAANSQLDTLEWLSREHNQIINLALSFTLIAAFWVGHHQLFDKVEHVTNALIWLTMLWLAAIVWLPVVTSVLGQLRSDALQKLLYIGTLLIISLVSLITRYYLRAHPGIHRISADAERNGISFGIISSALFATALALSMAVPELGYYPMLVLMLGPLIRRLTARAPRHPSDNDV